MPGEAISELARRDSEQAHAFRKAEARPAASTEAGQLNPCQLLAN